MKTLFYGILLIVVIGIGGLVYRNAAEHPSQPIACPLDAQVCPDGTSVARTDLSCTFPVCPPPNVSLTGAGVAFAVPEGFSATTSSDVSSLATYTKPADASSVMDATIILRRYAADASSTALMVIQQTAINAPSGLPVGVTAFTSSVLGNHRFTVASIERFEGTVDTAYYLARGTDVLRFDAVDTNVLNWTDPNLDVAALPAQTALVKLLATLQVL